MNGMTEAENEGAAEEFYAYDNDLARASHPRAVALPLPSLDHAGRQTREMEAASLIRRMAERFDGASNGKCTVCGAGRQTDRWAMHPVEAPAPCSNASCLSHDIRTFILNTER